MSIAHTLVFLLTLIADSYSRAQPIASPIDAKCVDKISVHECAKVVTTALPAAKSLNELVDITSRWNHRFEAELIKLRAGPIGSARSKNDVALIKEAIIGELPDEKDAAKELAKHAPVPKAWKDVWLRYWKRYLEGISAFLSSPVTKALVIAIRPSEVATDYDELLKSNKTVDDALLKRMKVLVPETQFIDTISTGPYKRSQAKLLPKFELALPPPR